MAGYRKSSKEAHRLNQAGIAVELIAHYAKCTLLIRDPKQAIAFMGPRIQTCHLVLRLGDALSLVWVKKVI